MKVILEKEDCYCDLDKFYENVARKTGAGSLFGFDMHFDCREICVTKAVKDELWTYYYKETKNVKSGVGGYMDVRWTRPPERGRVVYPR